MQAEKSQPTLTLPTLANVNNSTTISIDYTSIRSKTVLISPTEEQFELLKKRLQDRIDDSRGETIYDVGIGEGNVFFNYLSRLKNVNNCFGLIKLQCKLNNINQNYSRGCSVGSRGFATQIIFRV